MRSPSTKTTRHWPTTFVGSACWLQGLFFVLGSAGVLKPVRFYDSPFMMCLGLFLLGIGFALTAAASDTKNPPMYLVWPSLGFAILGPFASMAYYAFT